MCFFFYSYLLTEPNEPIVQLVVPSSSFLRSFCALQHPYRTMSAAQTQNDREQRWGCLESLGISQKELVLAEALQMEYDALARHRQDKGPANTLPPETSKSSPVRSEPSMPRRVPSPPWNNLQQGVSGSDSMLNHVQPGVSNLSQSSGESHGFSKEPRYILDEWERDFEGTAQLLSKGLPDEPPPPVPPRNPIPQNDPFIVHRSSAPRDVNLFTPEVDQPKLSFGDTLNYDNLNDSLSKLNGDWLSPNRSRRVNENKSGKAVARSNTLPPQVPPRTYLPAQKSTRCQRRVSVDPVSIQTILFYNLININYLIAFFPF